MKKVAFLVFLVFCTFLANAQERHWIFLADKPLAEQKMQSPQSFLSQRAIDRRVKQNIQISASDVPVHDAYVEQIRAQGITVLNTSKWLNAVSVYATQSQIKAIEKLPFVIESKPVLTMTKQSVLAEVSEAVPAQKTASFYNYGNSANQIEMLRGEYLHDNESRGEGMLIAQLDGGFDGVQNLPAFDSLWARKGILATYDFVDNDTDVFHGGTHGMNVLSVMAGYLDGMLIGTAPKANYLLLKSENESSETTTEEDNWVAAAEFADSAGAAIINSSLGYSTFDGGQGNYTWDDLDGRTATTSKAAVMAARKGILVVNSAGNEGGSGWRKIITPADADSILAIGGVDFQRLHVEFSSQGLSADGRIKPDISAQAQGVYVSLPGGNVGPGNGTSFAAPLIAGLSACLWQRFPDATVMEIRNAIIESSDRFFSPDSLYGYGIPDFFIADYRLSHPIAPVPEPVDEVTFFPNPFTDNLSLYMRDQNYPLQVKINVFDIRGNTVDSREVTVYSKFTALKGFESYAAGSYIFEVTYNGKSVKVKMLR